MCSDASDMEKLYDISDLDIELVVHLFILSCIYFVGMLIDHRPENDQRIGYFVHGTLLLHLLTCRQH